MLKVLAVDNDVKSLHLLSTWLEKSGVEVSLATNPQKAIELASRELPDIIILELLLDNTDGIELVRQLRNDHLLFHTIMVVMSTRTENYTQIAAFNAGADDFILKPLNRHWLNGKLTAWARRLQSDENQTFPSQKQNGLELDHYSNSISFDGQTFVLSKKEFDILTLLASRPQKVFSRNEIQSQVWRTREKIHQRTIDIHIHKLRKKLGSHRIKTVKGIGYRFEF